MPVCDDNVGATGEVAHILDRLGTPNGFAKGTLFLIHDSHDVTTRGI